MDSTRSRNAVTLFFLAWEPTCVFVAKEQFSRQDPSSDVADAARMAPPHTPIARINFLGRLRTAGLSEAVWFQRCCSAVVFSGPCRQTNFLEGITPAGESPEAAAVYTAGPMLQLCGRCPGCGRLFRLCFVGVT